MSIAWQVQTFAQLPSTQDRIRELAEAGAPEGTVVQSLVQTQGRGRHGNEWISPMGNLYMSMLLRPGCSPDQAGQISFVAAVALSAAMGDVLAPGHAKTLKWPNDVLIDGKKCAGILLESELKSGMVDTLILGMGVNIMAPPEDRIGINQVSKGPVPIHPFRDMVLSHFSAFYEHWRTKGFAEIRALWLQQAHNIGKAVTVKLQDRTLEGIFQDIDEKGILKLCNAQHEIIDVLSGDIYFS